MLDSCGTQYKHTWGKANMDVTCTWHSMRWTIKLIYIFKIINFLVMLTSSRYFKGAVASAAALRNFVGKIISIGVCVIENFVWGRKRSWDFAHVQVGHLNLPNWQTKKLLDMKVEQSFDYGQWTFISYKILPKFRYIH